MLCEITFNLFHIGKYLIQNLYRILNVNRVIEL